MSKPQEMEPKKKSDRRLKFDTRSRSTENVYEYAKIYWRLILESLGIGLGIWLLSVAGPKVGISVPPLFFIPTAYTIAIAFIRDPSNDRVRAFSFAILIGFIFLIIVSAIAPFVFELLNLGST
jgi:hypothetical protein